jgi:hypothetical protein
MSGPVRSSDPGLAYPEREYGTDDVPIDLDATPATAQSFQSFRASTNALVAPATLLGQIIPFPHTYKVNHLQAIRAGLTATIVFTLFWYPLYLGFKNSSMDICLLLGSFVVPGDPGWWTRIVGIGMHLCVGVAFALAYAYALLVFRTQSHAGKGVLYGAGLFMFVSIWVLPWMPPLLERLGQSHAHFDLPSPFLEWLGAGDAGWDGFCLGMVAHLMYGMMLGAVYRHRLIDPEIGV